MDINQKLQNAQPMAASTRAVSEGTAFGKNLIVDVFNAYYYGKDGNMIFKSENLTEAGISASNDQDEIRNGQGNGLFAVLNKNKTVEVTLSENVFDFKGLALNSGTNVVIGEGLGYTKTQNIVAVADSSNVKITLEKEPREGAAVMCSVNNKVVNGTLSGSDITFTTGVLAGDVVTVEAYEYTVPSAEKIVIKSDEFPRAGKLVLQTLEISPDMEPVAYIYIVFDKATPTGTWEINTTSEKQATETSYNMKISQNDNKELLTIYRELINPAAGRSFVSNEINY